MILFNDFSEEPKGLKQQVQLAMSLENSSQFADSILSLPLYPGLSKQQLDHIIQTVNDFKF